MRVHIHRPDAQGVVTHPDVPPSTTIRELIEVDVDERVFRLGDHTEIDLDITIVEVFGEGPGHVVIHPCTEIAVTGCYAGRTAEFRVHPSDPVDDVRDEAVRALGLDTASSADLILRVAGSTVDLVATYPIGSYVAKGTCSITLDLVHLVRPQG